jgi:Nucleoside transporter
MASNQHDQSKPAIYWIFFWASGVATLFVWNAVVSQTDYMKNRFRSDVDKIYPFYNFLGGLIAFFLYYKVFCRLKLKQRITLIPLVLVVISIAFYYVGEYAPKSSTKFSVLMALCFADGFFSSIIQTSLIAYSFLFDHYEISYCSAGGALVAIFINLVSFANEYTFEHDRYDIKGLLYLAFQITILSILMVVFGTFASRCPKDMSKADNLVPRPKKEILQAEEKRISMGKKGTPSLTTTFKNISSYFFNLVLTYTITLSVYPGFCLDLGLNWSSPAATQIILFVFNLFDCLGKWSYSLKKMPDNWIPQTLCLIRTIFVAVVVYIFGSNGHPELIDKPWFTVLFTGLLGLSNGYLTAGLFSLSAERSPPDQRDNAGFLMTLALSSGLCYGSLCTTISTTSA